LFELVPKILYSHSTVRENRWKCLDMWRLE